MICFISYINLERTPVSFGPGVFILLETKSNDREKIYDL